MELNNNEQKADIEIKDRSIILDELHENISNLVIENEKQFGKATELLKRIKVQIKEIENKRKDISSPIDKLFKAINAKFKPISTRAREIKDSLESKIAAHYRKIEEEERIKAEKKRQKELEKMKAEENARKLALSFLDDDEQKEIEPINTEIEKELPPPPPEIKRTFKAEKTTTTIKKVPVYEIIDASKVPTLYQSPDHRKIMQALNHGVRIIPGLKITEKDQIISR